MKKFLMALAVLAIASAPALAGPNAGGTLIIHDTGLAYTSDTTAYPSAPPATCEGADINLPVEGSWVFKVYAAFPDGSSPRLKALPMGEQFGGDVSITAGGMPDPVLDFEIPQNGWPTTSGGGNGISFGIVKTAQINEVYWFGGYSYSGVAGGIFAMVPHPVQPMIFVDDQVPPSEDDIAGLSSIGFGVDGTLVCPGIVEPGACCFADGSCQIQPDAAACEAAGGINFLGSGTDCDPDPCPDPQPEGACCIAGECQITLEEACSGEWQGPDTVCDPNPCEPPVPTENTSWGQIKANYR